MQKYNKKIAYANTVNGRAVESDKLIEPVTKCYYILPLPQQFGVTPDAFRLHRPQPRRITSRAY